MQIEQKDYLEHSTPYDYSYSPDTDNWYKDEETIMPEPKSKSIYIDNFVIKDVLGTSYNSKKENEKDFQNFIAFNFGVENGEDVCAFSIANIPLFPYDSMNNSTLAVEIYYFDTLLKFAENIEKGKDTSAYIESYSKTKFFAWQREDNKIRFAVQRYCLDNDYKTDFVFLYDVIVKKTQLVSELKRVVNKYIEKIRTAIKTYEKENYARFTNIRQNPCLKEWVLEDDNTYNMWTAKKFITATKLEEFINQLKPQVIGKPINKVTITGNLFNQIDEFNLDRINGKYYECEWIECNDDFSEGLIRCRLTDYDPDNLEEYCADLDEPVIIQIGEDINFEIDFSEHSLAQIGINTLKEGDYLSHYGYCWRDITSRYKKNIIGHNIVDVYINKTDEPSISWQVKREKGNDMYDEIGFVLDNGFKLIIYCCTDFMEVQEVKPNKK